MTRRMGYLDAVKFLVPGVKIRWKGANGKLIPATIVEECVESSLYATDDEPQTIGDAILDVDKRRYLVHLEQVAEFDSPDGVVELKWSWEI